MLQQREPCKVLVHHTCRRKFVDTRKVEKYEMPRKRFRSSIENTFEWKTDCFLCTKKALQKYSTVARVETLPLIETLIKRCDNRCDAWGNAVHSRLTSCNDLVAEEAIYHISCMNRFRLQINKSHKRGRPLDSTRMENFQRVCQWLEEEGDSELYTLSEVHSKMEELSEDTECYSKKYLKEKLIEYYGNHIYFTERPGRPNLLCFKDMASWILADFKKKQNQSPIDIIDAAAKIIKSDIREIPVDKCEYPKIDEMSDMDYEKRWVPESLQLFLGHLFPSKLKQMSFGQCIAQASRPRSMIAPIPFGIGVDVDKSFGTRWLVDHLAKFGFSISSDEVKLFKQSAASVKDTQEDQRTHFTQWVADNVDHNIRTLTGKGTFHGMGIISISSSKRKCGVIQRLKHNTKKDFSDAAAKITPYQGSSYYGLLKFELKPIKDLALRTCHAPEMNLDLLWHAAWLFAPRNNPRPNWSGYMMHVTSQVPTVYEAASIRFLPIIDLNPSDETCIFSTLLFVMQQAKKLNIPTPCITFDQPLWQKAMGIIKEQNLQMVCRLGGFHTLMSFLGSIGNLMKGSGLEEVFEEVYSEDTVKHIISGHAVARALRAHLLVQSALVNHINNTLIDEGKVDVSELEDIYNKAMKDGMKKEDLEELGNNDVFRNTQEAMSNYTKQKSEESRTAKLWLLYINYIEMVKEFLTAERSCNWYLHIQTLAKMMNLFAASGHINYAKCSRLYVQEMLSQLDTNPWLLQQFQNGRHAVRRSERFWSGLWSDLVIEQTLMRSIKCTGGLTRGRGFGENVRNLWVMSINHSAAVHEAMIKLSDVNVGSRDQNIDMGTKRRECNYTDCQKFYDWFTTRNPFNMKDGNLCSLSSGVVSVKGNDNVNCDEAEIIGARIQDSLDNLKFSEAKFKRKDQFVSLASFTRSISIGGKNQICVNPTLLFTRLAAIAEREENVEQYFDFELTNQPQSLFKNELMRKPDKAALRNILLTDETAKSADKIEGKYVLDGGALLHRVHWRKRMKFSEIAEAHVSYVRNNYGQTHIVFDGYEDTMSTKSNEHSRRSSNGMSQNVVVREDNEVPYTRECFLSNAHNKSQLISLLADYLRRDGHVVHVCTGDADTKIVATALELANEFSTIVVADDTDVATMLLYHWKDQLLEIYFLQERGKKCWSVKEAAQQIPLKDHLLFIHAWSGCDSTSSIFGKGKPSFMRLVQKSKEIQFASEEIMSDYWATEKEVGEAAVKIFTEVYGGTKYSTLRKLR